MRRLVYGEKGVALITVMLFMVLLFILITSMLTVTGNEVVISGLHRDSTIALAQAQAGVQEAARRMEAGRPFQLGFTSSLHPNVTVTVTERSVQGIDTYHEIFATATVGKATRRVNALVMARSSVLLLPNLIWGNTVTMIHDHLTINSGDVYTRHWLKYEEPNTSLPPNAATTNTYNYAAWRIWSEKDPPLNCVKHSECLAQGVPRAYPAIRRAVSHSTTLGAQIKAETNSCVAGGGGILPSDSFSGFLQWDTNTASAPYPASKYHNDYPMWGHDIDDPDGLGPIPAQAVTSKLPCGLPFKLIKEQIIDPQNGQTYDIWFKTIVFEQWFENYWQYDATLNTYVKNSKLVAYPEYAAIPPSLDYNALSANPDIVLTNTGPAAYYSGDLGCKQSPPAMSCAPAVDRPMHVVLNGNWKVKDIKGHGLLMVNGTLLLEKGFEYWGTIVVNGTLTSGGGDSHTIHGGLVTENLDFDSGGHGYYNAGTTMNNLVTGGPLTLTSAAWWER